MTADEKRAVCKKKGYSVAYAEYWVRNPSCEVCHEEESIMPHHLQTRGAHGVNDEAWNLLALGLRHDRMIHTIGDLQLGRQVGGEVQKKINAAKRKS
jgi:hypothetical protein